MSFFFSCHSIIVVQCWDCTKLVGDMKLADTIVGLIGKLFLNSFPSEAAAWNKLHNS